MCARATGYATPLPPEPASSEASARLRKLRGVAWLLDSSIPIGRWRVGLDPIIGLVPGVGDWVGSLIGVYVLYQGARLGMPANVLLRMAGNLLIEAVVGAIPVLGDLFDFAYKANTRNLHLVERHYRPELPPRRLERIGLGLLFFVLVLLVVIAVLIYLVVQGVLALIARTGA